MPISRFSPYRPASSRRGFTLIEMLIAVFFMSMMMAGMLRIYAASTKSFTVGRESITAQRANRWALSFLKDDVEGMGLYYPIRPVPSYVTVAPGRQHPVMVLPNQTLTYQAFSPDGSTPTETVTFDELQSLTDVSLSINATLRSDVTAGVTSVTFNVDSGNLADLQAGDIISFLDQNSADVLRVGTVSGSSVTIAAAPTTNGLYDASTSDGIPYNASTQSPHLAGTPVMFIRPNMVIRYSIQADALDPANNSDLVPVLVREMAPYPTSGNLLAWSTFVTTPPTGYTRERIAANVAGLRIDMSLNGGQAWARASASSSGTAGWTQMAGQINAQLAPNASITDPQNPLWYRANPALFRFDLQTRSSNLRAESSATGNAFAYKTRTQTLFVSPRNFTLGL